MAVEEREPEEEQSLRDALEDAFDDDYYAQNPDEAARVDAELEGHESGDEPAEQEGQAAEQEAPKKVDPPARWTKEEKEEFEALDPNVQRVLLARNKGLEANYTRRMQEIAQERQRYSGIEQELASRRETWQRAGMTDADALRSIMSYWDLSQKDPVQFLQVFSQERGIDLASAFGPTPEQLAQLAAAYAGEDLQTGQAVQPVNPVIQQQLQQLTAQQQQLQQVIAQQQQELTARQQAERQSIVQQSQNALNEFASATDENGSPLHPFFEDVRKDMAAMLKSGLAKDLKSAYDRAVRMNDSTWQRMEESRELARRRQQEQASMEEAARAKRASASLSFSGSPSSAPAGDDGDEENMSIRDIIKRQFTQARVGERV